MPLLKSSPLAKAEAKGLDYGIRMTQKRRNVLSVLLAARRPLSAYDVSASYQETFGEALPAMSAYRMIDALRQANLVHRLETTHQFIACSHIACDHAHEPAHFIICERCGAVRELGVRPELLEELKAGIARTGFSLTAPQLEFRGLCAQCNN
jgi:Fur family zinc uptake transcriptional regulator